MKFTRTALEGVWIIEPQVFKDARGFFFESYSQELFAQNGIEVRFVQDNVSVSAKGTLRGLHYQIAPKAQAKLLYVTRGQVLDVVLDLRSQSKTFGKYICETLSQDNKKMLFIPEGFAHGFCALCDDTEFHYKVSDHYSPKHEAGIAWNDPALGIPWPVLAEGYLLSEKDKHYPVLSQAGITKSSF